MTRQAAYIAFRGGAAVLFLLSITVIPRGAPAIIACVVAGAGGILSCIGVNAGGPGEQAGARLEQVQLDRTRAPQGDWPPFPEDKVIEGEALPGDR
jgi:hypothetical protein